MEDLPITLRIVVLFFLLGVNSFFSAAEAALVSVRHTRMRELAEQGNRRARMVLDLIESPDRMLSATQLGVTLASLGLGWAGESTVYRMLQPAFGYFAITASEGIRHLLAFALAFLTITFLHMVLGEVVPKNLAIERSDRLALSVAPALRLFARATGFFVSFVKGSAERISRLMGLKITGADKAYSAEELKLVVSGSKLPGEAAEQQRDMLHRVIDFYDLTVREVMVPRKDLISLPIPSTIDQVVDCLARSRHSRIPVYRESPEHIVGVIYAKEIWAHVQQAHRWQALDRPTPPFRMQSFVRDVKFVPETKDLFQLLEEFQKRHYQLAAVVDEFGTVVGIVTAEDAIEQIVGEIREEHEPPDPPAAGGVVELDGITNIVDLENRYGIELPSDAGFETLAGFLLSRLGHIPSEGEQIEHDDRRYSIVAMDANRVATVRVEPMEPEDEKHV